MNTSPPKHRRIIFGIGCFASLLIWPFLLYYGYCWGWWARHSLLLQYLFQCHCPAASTEARYPEEVDVIVSACQESWVELSPSGRFLAVYQDDFAPDSIYLLDLQTMETMAAPHQPHSIYLTDDWGFRQLPDSIILDRNTGKQYPIREFFYAHSGSAINGYADLSKLAEALQQVNQVFLIEDQNMVVGLVSDFSTRPEHNFFITESRIPGSNPDRLQLFLEANLIRYQTLNSFPEEALSPDGKFVANRDGIFLTETNQKIVEGVSLWLRGWTYDGLGVIYSLRYRGPCLIQSNLLGCYFEVPQPVLLLKVPEEYLSSMQMP